MSPVNAATDPKAQARILDSYGKLPLSFEANHGQADGQVKFRWGTAGYTLVLTGDEAVLALRAGNAAGKAKTKFPVEPRLAASPEAKSGPIPESTPGPVVRKRLQNANPATNVTGTDELAGTSNYFIGSDPTKWRTNVPTYAKVKYEGIYSGIDLVYYGNQWQLEYDFVLQPGASPQAIRLGIAGAKQLRLEHGDLVLTSAGGDVHLRSPHIYQEANGVRREVRGGYVMKSKNEVGFEVAGYDRRRALVIDPVLAYSTYLGGSGSDFASAIAVDSSGNAYVTGSTLSTDFPIAKALQPTTHGYYEAFVTKFNGDGSALVYSTYLGGRGTDIGNGIAVDSAGNAYITGQTTSTNFPIENAVQATFGGAEDAFVTKFNADGSALVYSTYLGGSAADIGAGVAVDSAGNAYITGNTGSTNFPTKNAFQAANHGVTNAFVTKINTDGSALIYSTYLGGNYIDAGYGIAVDSGGKAYIRGSTQSPDFPTVHAIQRNFCGCGFVTNINADGSALAYSTFLWGQSAASGVAVDSAGSGYMAGSATNYTTTAVAFQPSIKGSFDAFVSKIAGQTFVNFSPTKLAFTTQVIGHTSLPKKLILTNNGSGTLTINKIFIGGLNPGDFAETNTCGASLAAGASCTISATFTPSAKNLRQAGLGVSGSDPASPQAIPLSGTGTVVSLSKSRVVFGDQTVGTTSAPQNVTLTNVGTTQLNFTGISLTGLNKADFFETNTCGTSIAAKASCTITVTFTPSATGTRKAGVSIKDDGGGSPQVIYLTGTGT